ncbi:hypothetical protein M405DRAFT_846883 [Rhizopogon salebrosus TDB-379]|nr:hypothetical protein M405DRAFT_846883 [Rhizopogon salebrosus TDB-379]
MELDGISSNASKLGEAAREAVAYITSHVRSHSTSFSVCIEQVDITDEDSFYYSAYLLRLFLSRSPSLCMFSRLPYPCEYHGLTAAATWFLSLPPCTIDMSMSQTRVLTRDQHNMLKMFLPTFKIARSGSVEEQDTFWENVDSQWFATWPECAVHFPDIQDDRALSSLQQTVVNLAVQHRRRRIRWFIHMNSLYQETRLKPSMLKDYFHVKKPRRQCFGREREKPRNRKSFTKLLTCPFLVPPSDAVLMYKKWATDEQEEFLTSYWSEYQACTAAKKYQDFWKTVNIKFFECWPERKIIFADLPDDQPNDKSWYRWKNNPSRLTRSNGSKGVLKFNTVLSGGLELKGTHAPQKMDVYSHMYYDKKVKQTADNEIQVDNVTDRGPKLNKRREVTHRMYSEESEEVKDKVERKYQKAKAKHGKARLRLKSRKLPKTDETTRLKAIRELAPVLDRVLKYLAYMTGGWKFSILMGGVDPSTNEVSVFNYHVGELESGAQFHQTYPNFDAVQAGFLAFVKEALAFESTLPQESENEDGEEEEDLSSSDDNSDHEWGKSGDEHGNYVEDLLADAGGIQLNTRGLYRITPHSSVEGGLNEVVGNASLFSDASFGPIGYRPPTDNASLGPVGYCPPTDNALLFSDASLGPIGYRPPTDNASLFSDASLGPVGYCPPTDNALLFSDASLGPVGCSLAANNASLGSQFPSDRSQPPPFDPILGNINLSAFDVDAFNDIISDPDFDISALDAIGTVSCPLYPSQLPPDVAHHAVGSALSPTQNPAPLPEVLLPPAPIVSPDETPSEPRVPFPERCPTPRSRISTGAGNQKQVSKRRCIE